jgi:hypothetical protein
LSDGQALLRRAGAESVEVPPTPGVLEKRLQALENKENEYRKERKETAKRLQTNERT